MAIASRSRSSCVRNPTLRRRNNASSGARVLPAAMASASTTVSLMGALTTNAAARMAGHIRGPRRRKATTAIPVGGQTGVTFLSTSATRRLSSAAPQ
jgi:hypothetical protein